MIFYSSLLLQLYYILVLFHVIQKSVLSRKTSKSYGHSYYITKSVFYVQCDIELFWTERWGQQEKFEYSSAPNFTRFC